MEPKDRRSVDRSVWPVALVVVLGAIATILSTTSVIVAFAELSADLATSYATVQWVATGYLLGLATVIAATGWLARRIGARRLYLTTLGLFAATSILCALATSIESLIAFRILQGLAGGATMPVGQMMLVSAAGPRHMGRVMSVVGVPMLLGTVMGPALGGLLIDALSWHWVFLMNVPLALAALGLGIWLLPVMPTREPGRFDAGGFVLMALGPVLMVYGLARVGQAGVEQPSALVALATGIGLIGLFAVHRWRREDALLDLRLWSNGVFAASALSALLVSMAVFGGMVILPLLLQVSRGEDALTTGLLLMPQGVGSALALTLTGRLTDRMGGGRVALGGIAIVSVATLPFAFAATTMPTWLLCVLLFVRGLGIGGSIMPAFASLYSGLEPQQIPDAAPQLNILQRIGASFGTAILSVALATQLPNGGTSSAGAAEVAAAFDYTFAWAVGITMLALVPAAVLAAFDRRSHAAADIPKVHQAEIEIQSAGA